MKRILIHILFLSAVLFFWACDKKDSVSGNVKADIQPVPDQEMWDFDVKMTEKGKLQAHLKSGHMVLFNEKQNPYSILNQGVHVDFYDEDGFHSSTLTADSGMYQEKTRDVKAFKNVVIVSDSGVTMNTEAIEYDQEKEMVFTDLEVLITTTEGDSFWGDGFEADPNMENWKINQLHGIAHTGVDMSTEALTKKPAKAVEDTLSAPVDSTTTDTITVAPDSGSYTDEI